MSDVAFGPKMEPTVLRTTALTTALHTTIRDKTTSRQQVQPRCRDGSARFTHLTPLRVRLSLSSKVCTRLEQARAIAH